MSIGDGLRTEVVWILNDKCLGSSIIVPSEQAGRGNCENRKGNQEEIGKGGRIVVWDLWSGFVVTKRNLWRVFVVSLDRCLVSSFRDRVICYRVVSFATVRFLSDLGTFRDLWIVGFVV